MMFSGLMTSVTDRSIDTLLDYGQLVPRPPRPALSLACSTKSGEKAWTDLSRDACCC